ncbi:hypothetical protein DBR12_21305 [Acidovorax sp. HMWF029]|nr:hypothetical protein DBR12_21305 [Acidovorax sp. HMWF029]
MEIAGRLGREQPPEALRAFPLLSNRCAIREGGRRPRCGAALARRLSLRARQLQRSALYIRQSIKHEGRRT